MITFCHREKSLMVTKTDSGLSRSQNLKGRLNIDYGCGIGPKIVMNASGLMGIVSQSFSEREINLYEMIIN